MTVYTGDFEAGTVDSWINRDGTTTLSNTTSSPIAGTRSLLADNATAGVGPFIGRIVGVATAIGTYIEISGQCRNDAGASGSYTFSLAAENVSNTVLETVCSQSASLPGTTTTDMSAAGITTQASIDHYRLSLSIGGVGVVVVKLDTVRVSDQELVPWLRRVPHARSPQRASYMRR